jgi:hypothetical protein
MGFMGTKGAVGDGLGATRYVPRNRPVYKIPLAQGMRKPSIPEEKGVGCATIPAYIGRG